VRIRDFPISADSSGLRDDVDRFLRQRVCRGIIARVQAENALRPGLDPAAAADLLWTITSLRMWEDLVVHRDWSAEQYQEHVNRLLLVSLTKVAPDS
jgi:hypothetical protein